MDNEIKNEVLFIHSEDYALIKDCLSVINGAYIVEIDGTNIQDWEDYISEIESKFKFPTSCLDSIDRYLDYMRDLDWLEKEAYILIIRNFSDFMNNDSELKNEILFCFTDVILPFWQEEIKDVVVEGNAKQFNVYLVD